MNASFLSEDAALGIVSAFFTLGSENLNILINNQTNQVLLPYPSSSDPIPLQTPSWITKGNTILSVLF